MRMAKLPLAARQLSLPKVPFVKFPSKRSITPRPQSFSLLEGSRYVRTIAYAASLDSFAGGNLDKTLSQSIRNAAPLPSNSLASRSVDGRPVRAYTSENTEARYFCSYTIYKTKGAINARLVTPNWKESSNKQFTLTRKGSLVLEFASSTGTQKVYDWDSKTLFSLNAIELAQIAEGVDSGVEFFHDPNIGTENEGQVLKILRINLAPDGKNYFFTLNLTENGTKKPPLSISVTKAEFGVLKSIANFAIPRVLGFHKIADSD